MPLSWVRDEKKWKRSKEIVSTEKDKPEAKFGDRDWGLVTHIYKLKGGRIKKMGSRNESQLPPQSLPPQKYIKLLRDLDEAYDLNNKAWAIIPSGSVFEAVPYATETGAFIHPMLLTSEDGRQFVVEEFKAKMLSVPIRLKIHKFNELKVAHTGLTHINSRLKEFYEEEGDATYLRANFLLAKGVMKKDLTEFMHFVKSQHKYNGAFDEIYQKLGESIVLCEDGSYYVRTESSNTD